MNEKKPLLNMVLYSIPDKYGCSSRCSFTPDEIDRTLSDKGDEEMKKILLDNPVPVIGSTISRV